jgi:GTP-binding protein
MADIPGLIEGASQGKGLGHQFLKHIQRTRLLVYVIDINDEDIPRTRATLEEELAEFDASLAKRPSITVVTKTDTLSESDTETLSSMLPADYIYISAIAHQGVERFLQAVEGKLDQL